MYDLNQTPMIAQTIDEVLEKLEKIIDDSARNRDRMAYFASLYQKVTLKVKEGINNGQFGDGKSLEKLDTLFANRFLVAFQQWKSGKPVTKSWEIAFKAAEKSSTLILQHLLLGINAHINLDLGIATVQAADGQDLSELKKDYSSINLILSSLSYGVFHNLNTVSPFLSVLGFSGTKSNSMLVQFSIGNARDGSWIFAEDLIKLSSDDRKNFISRRDNEIAELATCLLKSQGLLRIGIWIIHLFENKNVTEVINILHTHQKLYKYELNLS